jgi:arabinose-5-phosphate isomerase
MAHSLAESAGFPGVTGPSPDPAQTNMTVQSKAADEANPDSGPLEVARRVLRAEAEGVVALANSLGVEFAHAVDTLFEVRGRVVVSGMGKSGHIARKIAATLASTGTPAMFVHPAEASHGDLGMITDGDAVIMVSNSGETAEAADLVTYCRRFSIPLLAVTSKPKSTLARNANVVLALPAMPEACPLGIVPTTSTTMTLALGDALAMALLDRHGFSSERFQELHPGGRLGNKLLKVSDVFHTGDALPLVQPDAPMSEALLEMSQKSFGCVGILGDGGPLAGIITDGDLRRHMNAGLLDRTASDVMTANPRTIGPGALASEALGHMNAAHITSLFVAEGGRVVGILHVHDCLRHGVDMEGRVGE